MEKLGLVGWRSKMREWVGRCFDYWVDYDKNLRERVLLLYRLLWQIVSYIVDSHDRCDTRLSSRAND